VKQNLQTYQELLHKWQKRINLVSNNTIKDSWERHFEDSLQIIDLIPEMTKNLVDLGSGAGFPGLVIAIEKPEISVTLVESDQKKCSFLKTVSRETNTDVNVINDRIQSWEEELEQCKKHWKFEYECHRSQTDENAVILVFRNISKIA